MYLAACRKENKVARVEGFEVGKSGIEPEDGSGNPVSVGVWGDSDNGMGVFGTSGQLPAGTPFFLGSEPAGVVGHSVQNPGVMARSDDNNGVLAQSRDASGVFSVSFSPNGSGVVAANLAGGNGVESFVGDGAAVLGSSRRTGTGVAGSNFGGMGQPATGVGVDGYNADTGIGVRGESPNGTGVHGESDVVGVKGFSPPNANGIGVWGHSDNGLGVWGLSNNRAGVQGGSSNGVGVEGSSSNNVGVRGSSSKTVGVLGSSSNGEGVRGSSEVVGVRGAGGFEGEGVRGSSFFNHGLRGSSLTASGAEGASLTGDGVSGSSNSGSGVVGLSTQSWAGEFFGDVRITGNVSFNAAILPAGAGILFRTDHPTDPANKYLNHSSVASPEMKNVYDGVVELDEDGAARVELPEWFGELNGDFRYQLTPIGASAPGLYVAEEIADNRFKIAGGEPNMKVSWQVTGVRQERWAADQFEIEERKASEERGRYLRPELFGQPEATSIDTDPRREEQLRQIRRRLEQLPPQRLPSGALAGDEEQIRRVQELARQVMGQELVAEDDLPPEEDLPPQQALPPQQPPPFDFMRYEEKLRQMEESMTRLRRSWESETPGT
jgi:hypothetical protein